MLESKLYGKDFFRLMIDTVNDAQSLKFAELILSIAVDKMTLSFRSSLKRKRNENLLHDL